MYLENENLTSHDKDPLIQPQTEVPRGRWHQQRECGPRGSTWRSSDKPPALWPPACPHRLICSGSFAGCFTWERGVHTADLARHLVLSTSRLSLPEGDVVPASGGHPARHDSDSEPQQGYSTTSTHLHELGAPWRNSSHRLSSESPNPDPG